MKEECSNCKYSHDFGEDDGGLGCRLHPRVHVPGALGWEFPNTRATDWCGQWDSKFFHEILTGQNPGEKVDDG